jgi:hypothetical protein
MLLALVFHIKNHWPKANKNTHIAKNTEYAFYLFIYVFIYLFIYL